MLKLAITLVFALNVSEMLTLEWSRQQALDLLVIRYRVQYFINELIRFDEDKKSFINKKLENFWKPESTLMNQVSRKISMVTNKIENEISAEEVDISSCKETSNLQVQKEKYNLTLQKIEECESLKKAPISQYTLARTKIFNDGLDQLTAFDTKSDNCFNDNYDKDFDKAYRCISKIDDEVSLAANKIMTNAKQEFAEFKIYEDDEEFDLAGCSFRHELIDIFHQLSIVLETFKTCVQQKNEQQ